MDVAFTYPMSDGKHTFKGFTILLIGILLSSISIQSSSAETFFPTVHVALKNDASHSIYLKCGFDASEDNFLQKVEPGETRSWSFTEILFPLKWCYVHVDNDIRGAFWAFTVFLKCIDCHWSIRDDGPYHFTHLNDWRKQKLFIEY